MESSLTNVASNNVNNTGGHFIPPLPTSNIEIVPGADASLLVRASPGTGEVIALGVFSQLVGLASPLFAAELAICEGATDLKWMGKAQKPFIDVTRENNSYAWLICMNMIHLQHDMLPNTLDVQLLLTVARFARKYAFVEAVSLSTSNWFDHLYNEDKADDLLSVIEAAMLLNHAVYFSRFTARLVLEHRLLGHSLAVYGSLWQSTKILGNLRLARQLAFDTLRRDVDFLLEPLAVTLSKSGRHYPLYGQSPNFDDDDIDEESAPEVCTYDTNKAMLFLSSLSDATIWPSFSWPDLPGGVISMIREWRVPITDPHHACDFCLPLTTRLEERLRIIRTQHTKRQWGLCLDCFIAGRTRQETCRVEHMKDLS